MPRLTVPAVLFISLASAARVFAQQPSAPPPQPAAAQAPASQEPALPPQTSANTITQNVNLVILDGVAIDSKGRQVNDLRREDFHITEDDAPQQVRDFETPGRYTPPASVSIDSTADLDRLAPRAPVNIVLLDEFNTRFEDMAFARYSLKKWLEKQPGKLDTPTMLIAVSLSKFEVLHDYTENKDEIIRALDHHFAAYPWQVHNYSWIAERYTTAFLTLRRVAEATIGHEGHKNMIWVGRGFPTISRERFTVDENQRLDSAFQQTVNELRDARVTLYTIDPAGVMTDPGAYGQDAQDFAPFGGDPDFDELSRATGGRNLHGRNDVDAEIGTSIRDGASFYTLTYRPTNPEIDPNKFRKIKVTIDRPGVIFITRRGYYQQETPVRPDANGHVGPRLSSELIDAADSNMAYDAVGFALQASQKDPHQFTVVVQSKGLAWYYSDGSAPRYTNIIVLGSTFDKKGRLIKTEARRYKFEAPEDAPARGHLDLGLRFPYALAPDPKAVRLRMVVRVEASGHMGSADVMLNPGAVATSAAWIRVTRSTPAPAAPAAAPSAPAAAPANTPPGPPS